MTAWARSAGGCHVRVVSIQGVPTHPIPGAALLLTLAMAGLAGCSSDSGIRRGWTRMMGLVKTSIMLVAVVAANNIDAVRRHARTTGHSDEHHLLKGDPPYYGFVQITDQQEFVRQHSAVAPEPDPPD